MSRTGDRNGLASSGLTGDQELTGTELVTKFAAITLIISEMIYSLVGRLVHELRIEINNVEVLGFNYIISMQETLGLTIS